MVFTFRFRLALCLPLALTLSVLSGCTPSGAPLASRGLQTASAQVVSSPHPAVLGVRAQPLYRQAEQACHEKRYLAAAHLLQSLAASPGLSDGDRDFVQQQVTVCLQDAGLPVPRPKPHPAARVQRRAAVATSLPSLTPEQADCGPRALALVCQSLAVPDTVPQLRLAAGTTGEGTTLEGLAKAAEAAGLKAEGLQVSREALPQIQTPAIAWVNQNHYIAVLQLHSAGEQSTVRIHDPNAPGEETISQERLLRLCGGILLTVHR